MSANETKKDFRERERREGGERGKEREGGRTFAFLSLAASERLGKLGELI